MKSLFGITRLKRCIYIYSPAIELLGVVALLMINIQSGIALLALAFTCYILSIALGVCELG